MSWLSHIGQAVSRYCRGQDNALFAASQRSICSNRSDGFELEDRRSRLVGFFGVEGEAVIVEVKEAGVGAKIGIGDTEWSGKVRS
jgi:hypothetical protein